ncbi:MAG: neutral/alkaline non-lysosomal ceramidase N-terminal domain-containing protein [Planctomycetes bacterium]|nr:neutral/alkaline non-lysosomal ceramidase N-terminal domain-containing protein [Planctomycetota bacterium]
MRTASAFGLLLALLPTTTSAAEPPTPYKAGIAKTDITPGHAIRLNGFGFRRTESEGVYHQIHARALAIDDGKAPAVLVTVDVLGIPADIYDEVARRLEKRAGLKKERLAITATHTHTGPMLTGANPTIFGVPIPKEHQASIDKYTPVFIDKLEAVALAALKDVKPAKLEWGVGRVGFAMNRRAKGGPIDHDLPVLFVKDEKGAVRAVYLNYACHCVTLSHNKIGGDWAGFAAAAIEDTFSDAVALVAIGGGADQNPNSGVTGAKEDVATAQGREIAAEVRRLSQNFLAPVTGEITAKVTTLELPLAALPTREQWEEKAKRMDAIGHHARVTLAKLDRGEKLPTKVDYPVQTWTFGTALAMVQLPGEVVVDYPLRLKRELDARRLFVTGYVNNAPCYIPSERVLKVGGYEGGGAMIYYDLPVPFAPGLEDKIVGAVKDHIGRSFAARFDPNRTGDTLPLSPQQSQQAIKTKPGLRVDLVAAEPLVADPVALAFGPDGKLWVAEMADYPLGRTGKFDPGGRIVFLEDTNGDGTFDKSTVFLDGLPFPTGVLPWRKGVLICAAPDILYAEDTDGDGKADKVEKLYSGFGTENYQARVNSLQYGLDGWVYGSCGLFGGNILCHKTGKTVALGNRDFRVKPDTGELEPATGRTQQGRVRDDRGNWFGCDNSNFIRHYVLEDHYLKRNPYVAYPNASVNVAPSNKLFSLKSDAQRFALSGPPNTVTAACGLGLYRDDLLGKEFYGNSFTCEPVNLLVTRRVLKPNGSTFAGERAADELDSEFLASTDGWFRPVHVLTGPDGGLWVADMYRYLIEHPRWIPQADLVKIDVRAGSGLGRIYRVRSEKAPLRPWVRLDKLDTAGLVAALDSPNGWQRDTAMMMLVWKNDPAAKEPLEKLVRGSKNGLARMQALCALGEMGEVSPKVLEAGTDDYDPGVRRQAIRLLEPHFRGEVGKKLNWILLWQRDHNAPQVHLQLAYALGVPHPEEDRSIHFQIARIFAKADDPYFIAAAMSSLNKENIRRVADGIGGLLGSDFTIDPAPQTMRDLLASAAGIDNGSALPDVLNSVTTRDTDGSYRVWQLAAVYGALDSLERQGKPWEKLTPELLKAVNPPVAFARRISAQENAAEADLLGAIPLLGRDPASRADDLKRLAGLLAATRPAAVQSAAVSALARTSDKATPAALVGAFGSASPVLRARILDALLGRPAWHAELLAAVEKGRIPAGQIDAARRQRLTGSPDAAVRKHAEKLFAGSSNPDRQKVIDDYKAALALKGDKTRGKAVFAKSCSACHALEGVGAAVGPDLSALANKSPLYLLSEILDPNRNLDSRYAEYQALTKDDRTVSGILAAETATSITLRGQQAKEETILRTFIETLRGTSKSLMPEGLEKDIAKQDMADLLAYLTANEPPHKKLAGNEPAEIAMSDNALTLPATRCFVHGGGPILFEPDFKNIGYWNRETDYVVWKVKLDRAAEFDVYLDYACANDSGGNPFAVDGAEPALRGKVAPTGGWDRYTLVKLGTVRLPAGAGRITFRPDAPVKNALLDLRTLYLVPVGTRPKVTAVGDGPRSPAELAKLILDDSTPKDRRAALVTSAVPHAAEVILAMTADLPAGDTKEEYRRIPWIWRVAVAAGRADDAKVLPGVFDVSLPKRGEALRHWQAVVLGGGVINGLGLEGKRPGPRFAELVRDNPERERRWSECLKHSHAMADDEKVPTGTRYDALRIVALDDWKLAEPRLTKYLAKSANAELQQGAVSGLVDVEGAGSAALLVAALPDLTPGNRNFALAGLLRTPARTTALLNAVEKGSAKPEWLTKEHRDALSKHADEAVRTRAAKLLGGN